MADAAMQTLLDIGGQGNGLIIRRRVNAGLNTSYYVAGDYWNFHNGGSNSCGYRAGWVDVLESDSDGNKVQRIRDVLGGFL